jgi:hypothetical protein
MMIIGILMMSEAVLAHARRLGIAYGDDGT